MDEMKSQFIDELVLRQTTELVEVFLEGRDDERIMQYTRILENFCSNTHHVSARDVYIEIAREYPSAHNKYTEDIRGNRIGQSMIIGLSGVVAAIITANTVPQEYNTYKAIGISLELLTAGYLIVKGIIKSRNEEMNANRKYNVYKTITEDEWIERLEYLKPTIKGILNTRHLNIQIKKF